MTIFGALRVKNESRWIRQVIGGMTPICERIYVFDDNSSDGTAEVCESIGEDITVIRSTESTLNETRDKQVLLQRIMAAVPDIHLRGNERSPFWCLMCDGDEVLDTATAMESITSTLPSTTAHAFSLPIRFLWDSDLSLIHTPGHRRVRVDGVYARFANVGRPSLFRLMNAGFRYQSTPWGGNFHCSSIPQELLHHAHGTINAPLWHTGYNDQADRVRKFQFYNSVDPGNEVENEYRHIISGDGPVEADGKIFESPAALQLKHAGPLSLVMM